MNPQNKTVVNYWLNFYATEHCTLCGQTGVIDTRNATTPAGYKVGRLNWCICPNGQIMRDGNGGSLPPQQSGEHPMGDV